MRPLVEMALSKPPADLETTETASDAKKDILCAACCVQGDLKKAVKYCIDCNQPICQLCVDCHGRFKQLKDHKLVDCVNEDSLKLAEFLSSCLFCPNHPDKNIELMCKDHAAMCCLTCATVNHRTCTQVLEVSTEAANVNITSVTKDLEDHLDAAKTHMEEIVKQRKTQKANIELQENELIPQKLNELRSKLNRALDELESYTLKKGSTHVNRCDSEIGKWTARINTVKEAAKLLSTVQVNGTDAHIYIAVNKIEKSVNEIDQKISDQGNRLSNRSIDFKELQPLLQVLKCKPQELIKLSVKATDISLPYYKYGSP